VFLTAQASAHPAIKNDSSASLCSDIPGLNTTLSLPCAEQKTHNPGRFTRPHPLFQTKFIGSDCGLHGAERRSLEAVLIHKRRARVSPRVILAPAVAEPPSGAHLLLKVRLGSLADIVSQPVHPTIERPPRVLEKPER
jgi:hypothetical protein